MSDFWQKFFDWLERVAPSVIAAFGVGFQVGQNKLNQEKDKNQELTLALELEKNKNEIAQENAGKSDADIVRDAIRKGGGGS